MYLFIFPSCEVLSQILEFNHCIKVLPFPNLETLTNKSNLKRFEQQVIASLSLFGNPCTPQTNIVYLSFVTEKFT